MMFRKTQQKVIKQVHIEEWRREKEEKEELGRKTNKIGKSVKA